MHRNYVADFFDNVDIKKNLDTEIDAYKRWSLFLCRYDLSTKDGVYPFDNRMYALLPLD